MVCRQEGDAVCMSRTALGTVIALAVALMAQGCGDDGPPNNNANNNNNAVDATAPVLTNLAIDPATLELDGGDVTLAVTATDDVGVAAVTFTVTPPSGTPSQLAGTANGTRYAAVYSAPGNGTGATQTYNVSVVATDAAGNASAPLAGEFEVLSPEMPPPGPSGL